MFRKIGNFIGVLGLLSAVSTFFGLRGFLRWLRQRPDYQPMYQPDNFRHEDFRRDQLTASQGMVPGARFLPGQGAGTQTGMTGFQAIPATGTEEVSRRMVSSQEDPGRRSEAPFTPSEERMVDLAAGSGRDGNRGPMDSSTEGPTGATPRVVPAVTNETGALDPGEGAPPTMETMGVAMGVDPSAVESPATAPAHQGDPGTPESDATPSTGTVAGIHAGPLDLPLVEALLAQEDLMAVLRERLAGAKRDPEKSPNSITPVDRVRFQHAVDRLGAAMGQVNEGSFAPGSSESRAYHIIHKVHDVLTGLLYSDEDIQRIDAEIRAEACPALMSIQHVVDWDKVYTLYGCGG